jgi:hypothetical protein
MKLLPAHIHQIKDFVTQRGFTEPDLQIEIIDHMACRVEELMSANPTFTLHHAIKLAHADFGIMGFSIFEDAMRSALQKRYFKVFRSIYLANFTWKTVPLMVALVYLVSIIFQAVNRPETVFTCTGLLLMLVFVVNAIVNAKRYKRYTKMLTFKMGNVYLVLSIVIFQLYNCFIIQLKLYQYLAASFTGLLFAGVILILFVTIYTINKTQQHAIASCIELEGKYRQMLS